MSAVRKGESAGNIRESLGVFEPGGPAPAAAPRPPAGPRPKVKPRLFTVPLSLIDPDPGQPRKHFDEAKLRELADGMRAVGQLAPIDAMHDTLTGRYVITGGERRYRAAALAGLDAVDVSVWWSGPLTPATLAEMRPTIRLRQFQENENREDMNPIEVSDALVAFRDECSWTVREIAEKTGMSPAAVGRAIQLHGLAERVRAQVRDGRLAPSTAVVIGRLAHDEQEEMGRIAVVQGLSRDAVEDLVYARQRGMLAPTGPDDPIEDPLSHRETGDGSSVGDPAGPIEDPLSHRETGGILSVPAGTPSPPAELAESRPASRVESWGCDLERADGSPGGTVFVELGPGMPRKEVAQALRNALAKFLGQESGADKFAVGDPVRGRQGDVLLGGKDGVVEGHTLDGKVIVNFPKGSTKGKPLTWNCDPSDLLKLSGKAQAKGGRP